MSEQIYSYEFTFHRRGGTHRLTTKGSASDSRPMGVAIIKFLRRLREDYGWDESETAYALKHIRSSIEAAASRDNALTVRAEITVPEVA